MDQIQKHCFMLLVFYCVTYADSVLHLALCIDVFTSLHYTLDKEF